MISVQSFCTATFGGGEPLATEIPNVLLKQPEVPKKCAAKAKQSLKRPAAVKPAIPAEPEACPTPLEEQPASWSYFILFSMFGGSQSSMFGLQFRPNSFRF